MGLMSCLVRWVVTVFNFIQLKAQTVRKILRSRTQLPATSVIQWNDEQSGINPNRDLLLLNTSLLDTIKQSGYARLIHLPGDEDII